MTKLRFHCRRCLRWKTKDFMVRQPSGYPLDLCLQCQAHDRIKQERYAKARAQAQQEDTP